LSQSPPMPRRLNCSRCTSTQCCGIGAAFGAEFLDRHLVLVELLLAILLLDLPLDRQAVAVPAGNVRRVLAQQRLRAHDHVLEHLVERVADVDVAVGVGRAVVEDELLAPVARAAQLAVEVLFLPAGEDPGSFCGRPAFIGKSVLGRNGRPVRSGASAMEAAPYSPGFSARRSILGPSRTRRFSSAGPGRPKKWPRCHAASGRCWSWWPAAC
jgi:hypothetical protein